MAHNAPAKPFTRRMSWDYFLGIDVSPMVFDSAHSGWYLPDHFRYACSRTALDTLQDPFVEYMLHDVFQHNAPLLINHIHRAVVDMNRHENEINPLSVKGKWHKPTHQGQYARKGHGVIPMQLGGKHKLTPIYNEASRPTSYEVNKRLVWYHRPYHQYLKQDLKKAHDFNGFAVHLNMHSMKRYPMRANASPREDIVIGTLHGQSAHPLLEKFAEDFFKSEGLSVSMNKPFSGAALIQATNAPHRAYYSMQIEIARDLYMDVDKHKLIDTKCKKMTDIMTRLAGEMDKFTKAHAAELQKGYTAPKPQLRLPAP